MILVIFSYDVQLINYHQKHVYREANKIEDGLASLARDSKEVLHLFHQPPDQMISLYQDDLISALLRRHQLRV